jgi:hypothetical protein
MSLQRKVSVEVSVANLSSVLLNFFSSSLALTQNMKGPGPILSKVNLNQSLKFSA